jgi:tRNA/tmRNA/rRNA uracil-C5-methylase (TrmA/RlmC/RlmD family)
MTEYDSFGGDRELMKEQAYQASASFVPKLAGKVLGWLDVQKNDVILDLGCGGMLPAFLLLQNLNY